MRIEPVGDVPIRIFPAAPVLPANTLRFYLYFPRPGEAHFDRARLSLKDEAGQSIAHPFLVLSQELWSPDRRRLTVLMEPGRLKRGMGGDPSHEPALVEGRCCSLEVEAFDQITRYAFEVGERVSTPLDEASWRVTPPEAGAHEAVVVAFDRVMDNALCEDELAVFGPAGAIVPLRASLGKEGRCASLVPEHPWCAGAHRLLFSSRLEDVCGNRLGEALDHDLAARVRPRGGEIVFTIV